MFRKVFLVVLSSLIFSSCDNNPSKEIGYGILENGTYTNSYFNMSIKLPSDWALQSQAAQKDIMDTGIAILAGENKNLKSTLKVSEKQTVNMFAIFRHEQGAPVDFNPSIISVAEKVSHMPGIKRGSDYNFHVKKLLNSAEITYSFPDTPYTEVLSGVSFDIMPASINAGHVIVNQKYYTTRIKDYVLGFVLSYSSESEEKSLNAIISTLEFD